MPIMKEIPDDGQPVQNRPFCAVGAYLIPLAPKIVRILRKGRIVHTLPSYHISTVATIATSPYTNPSRFNCS